ncbi:hypothetical protein M758_2G115500 [Ceratodon purpureus]|nr:hypothetical protein M758_2G115500 [Ceratodon purpureus]
MEIVVRMSACAPVLVPAAVSTSSLLRRSVPLLRTLRGTRGGMRGRVQRTRCYREEGAGSGGASSSPEQQSGAGGKTPFVLDSEVTTSGNLYPPLQSHKKGHLQVSNLHSVYYEVFGNPNGRPVVFLHGGPGAGCSDRHARFFDPQHYRIVLFDQRGCGKSTPRGCLEENTTWDLVSDIEQLRQHLGVAKWLVMGGSWGVTLALAYAQSHTDSVAGLILRGVCLLRPQEIDWFYKQGANALYPMAWEELLSVLEPDERKDVLSAYYKRLTGDDTSIQQRAAQAWLRWEMGLSFFSKSPYLVEWNGKKYQNLLSPLVAGAETTESSQNKERGPQRAPAGQPPTPGPAPTSSSTTSQTQSSSQPSPSSSSASSSTSESSSSTSQNKGSYSSQVAQARLESHYFINGGFFDDDQLIQGVPKMRHIPGIIVQGRYDFVCPIANAFDLHRAWPEAYLRIVPNAGHSMYDEGILYELVRAADSFKNLKY